MGSAVATGSSNGTMPTHLSPVPFTGAGNSRAGSAAAAVLVVGRIRMKFLLSDTNGRCLRGSWVSFTDGSSLNGQSVKKYMITRRCLSLR